MRHVRALLSLLCFHFHFKTLAGTLPSLPSCSPSPIPRLLHSVKKTGLQRIFLLICFSQKTLCPVYLSVYYYALCQMALGISSICQRRMLPRVAIQELLDDCISPSSSALIEKQRLWSRFVHVHPPRNGPGNYVFLSLWPMWKMIALEGRMWTDSSNPTQLQRGHLRAQIAKSQWDGRRSSLGACAKPELFKLGFCKEVMPSSVPGERIYFQKKYKKLGESLFWNKGWWGGK